jgi:hypothetical protein
VRTMYDALCSGFPCLREKQFEDVTIYGDDATIYVEDAATPRHFRGSLATNCQLFTTRSFRLSTPLCLCAGGRESLVTVHYCLNYYRNQFYLFPKRLTVATNYHPRTMLASSLALILLL